MKYLAQEEDIILSSKKDQVFYFYAPWMIYHKKMISMIGKMEEKYEDLEFLAIDVDFFKKQCIRFEIESIPTIIIFRNGKEIKRITGLVLTSAFKYAFHMIYNRGKKGAYEE